MQSKVPAKRARPIIRVFVSSTFSDLKHERNALHAKVWPELERYCQQRGFTFQAIDLRWGVPAEAGLDHRTMRICFEELRRSQETSPEPNFLILLGNRYGWRPLPEFISVEEFEKLKTAAEQIQSEPADLTRKPTQSQVELLKKAVSVLEDWYLLDENAKPFGDKTLLGEFVLRTRKTLLRGVDYSKEIDAGGKLRDTIAWGDVQFVMWSIVNLAFPAKDLAQRFPRVSDFPREIPSIVHFQASATEQEIWKGALDVENPDRHVIAAVREIDDFDAIPDTSRRGDFIDLKDDGTPNGDSRQALADLKAELERRLVRSPIIRSTCQWAIDQDKNPTGDITTSHLDNFCREIQDRFKSIIIEQINAYWGCDLSADDATLAQVRGSQQELDLECADHLRFAAERAPEESFVGRETELQRIRDYLHSETNQPFVVHGPSGSGKTALLGKIIQEVTPPRSADGTRAKTGPIVLNRFIGTTPESSNLRSLLSSLCRELRQDFEVTKTRETPDGKTETFSPPVPTDLNELIDEFYSQLGKATAARPVIVFLDALDQLDAADHSRSAFWIRSPLSLMTDATYHARMVVSCLSPSDEFPEDSEACEPFQNLKLRKLLSNHGLGALDENDARQLFTNWLGGVRRNVSKTQQDRIWSALRKSSACRQPLFLKVLFEEARRWRSFDAPSVIPESLAQLLDELFIRLGKPTEHGDLIGIALSCMVSARYGLSEGELLEVLYADPEYKAILAEDNRRNGHELPPDSNRIPIAPWTRLRSDLAAYLSERSAPGSSVIHFYHRQLEQAVRAKYLVDPELQTSWHRQLSDYFEKQDWWGESMEKQHEDAKRLPPMHRLANARKADELPWQLLRVVREAQAGQFREHMAEDYERVKTLFTEPQFLEAKTEAGMVFDLADDFHAALETLPTNDPHHRLLRLLEEALRREIQFIARHPATLFQCLWNLGWWYDSPGVAGHYNRSPGDETLPRPLFRLLEEWRETKERTSPGFSWVRSHRPPLVPLGSGLEAIFHGHRERVTSVAFSPRGNRIASASADGTVRIWDAHRGAELRCITVHKFVPPDYPISVSSGHEQEVFSVVFSIDGSRLATASWDNSVRVWNVRTGALLAELVGHEGPIKVVAYSPDGSWLASASADRTVRIWDARTGAFVRTLSGHSGVVGCVAFSADGIHLVSGSWDNTLLLWDVRTGEVIARLPGNGVTCVAFSPDGSRFASGSRDSAVRLWNPMTGEMVLRMDGHQFRVTSVSFSPDGGRLASVSPDGTVRVWDTHTGAELCRREAHGQERSCTVACKPGVAFGPDGHRLAAGFSDGLVRIWDEPSQSEPVRLESHTTGIRDVVFCPDGNLLASRCDDGEIRIWDVTSGRALASLQGREGVLSSMAFSPGNRGFVFEGADHTVRIWDPVSQSERVRLENHGDMIYNFAFSPDGCHFAYAWSGHVWIRELLTGTEWARLEGTGAVAFAPDSNRLACLATDGTIRVWDIQTRTQTACLEGHTDLIIAVAFSPDGSRVAAASHDHTVRVWDARTGTPLFRLDGHTWEVYSVAFSADGTRLASSAADSTLRIWDAHKGVCLEVIEGVGNVRGIDNVKAAAQPGRFPWWAINRDLEVSIEVGGRPLLAWFPGLFYHLTTHSDGRTWAAASGSYVCLFALEGSGETIGDRESAGNSRKRVADESSARTQG